MSTVPRTDQFYDGVAGFYDATAGFYDAVEPYYENPDPRTDNPRNENFTEINRAITVADGGALLNNFSTHEFTGDGTQGAKALPVTAYADNLQVYAITGSPHMPNVVPWLQDQQYTVTLNGDGDATHITPKGLIRWATSVRFVVLYNAAPSA